MKKNIFRLSYERKKALYGFLFVLPWVLGFLLFFLNPLIQSFVYSFHNLSITEHGFSMKFVGFDNYKKAFLVDPDFNKALAASLSSLLYKVIPVICFSMFIATILNQRFKGRTFVRAVFFLPVIIASGIVIQIIQGDLLTKSLMSSDRVSNLFQVTSMEDILFNFGLSPNVSEFLIKLLSDIFNFIWSSGVQITLLLAGIQGVPVSMYEASSIEGATAWENFWKITFPFLSPIILVTLIYTIIDTFVDSTSPVIKMIMDCSGQAQFDYGATLSTIYFLIVFLIIVIINFTLKRFTFNSNK